MALFRRKKRFEEQYPAEVQEYYKQERRERAGVAWLLAFGTLLMTVALSLALFFGGRWVWRQFFDSSDVPNISQTDEPASPAQQGTESSTPSQPTPPAGSTSSTRTVSPGIEDDETSTAPRGGDIPRTGPRETAIVFAAVSMVSGLAHRLYTTRREISG